MATYGPVYVFQIINSRHYPPHQRVAVNTLLAAGKPTTQISAYVLTPFADIIFDNQYSLCT
jgi:hypothetical protein